MKVQSTDCTFFFLYDIFTYGDNMELKKFDGKLISLTDKNGDTFEGICSYNSADCNEHEYGISEDGVEIFHFLFYLSDIESINCINKFSAPYGRLEELTAADEVLREQALEDEDSVHKKRLINYINDNT